MSVKTATPDAATAVTAVQVRQGEEGAFAGWLTELNKTISTFPDYVSAVVALIASYIPCLLSSSHGSVERDYPVAR